MKFIIAIDPGASGGIAYCGKVATEAEPMMQTSGDVMNAIRRLKIAADILDLEAICYLEDVGGFTGEGQPGSAMFKFGAGWGFIQGCLMTLGIPVVLVRPQRWQKFFSLGTVGTCPGSTRAQKKQYWKNKLKAEAQRRYPHLKVTLATADALLILAYAQHMEKGAQ